MQILAGVDTIGYSHKPGGCEYNGIKNRCRENHGWRDEKEIADLVGNRGHALLPGRFIGEVKGQNCKGMQLFPLDFDAGASYKAIADRCSEYELSFLFSYHTFSSSVEIEKFRLVFAMPFEITDLFIVKAITLILQKIFPEADRMCKDPARVFNGGKELIEFHEGARLSPVNLRYALHRSLDDGKHYAEQLNSFSRNSGIFHDGKSLLFGTMEEIPMFFGENTEDPPYIIHVAADSGNSRFFFAERLRVTPNLHRGSTTPVKLSDLDLRVGQCRLLSDFESGIPLNHSQKFGIMTNLIGISGGQKRFMETIRKYYSESAEKWERDLKYARNYHPQICRNIDCPYYDECNDLGTIFDTISVPIRPVAVEHIDYVPLEEAQENLRANLMTAFKENDTAIHLIRAQASIGKTRLYTEFAASDSRLKLIIAVPTNALKHEVMNRLVSLGVSKQEIFETPSISDNCFIPEHIRKHLQNCHNRGIHDQTGREVRELLKNSSPEDKARIEEYQKLIHGLDDIHGQRIIITTHSYLLNIPEGALSDYTVIVDEDILLLQIFPSIYSTDIHSLKCLSHCGVKAYEDLAKELLGSKPGKYYRIRPCGNVKKSEELLAYLRDTGCGGNVLDLTGAVSYTRTVNTDGSEQICYFVPRKLSRRKYIVLSATLDEDIYRRFFGSSFEIRHYPEKKARYKGKICQCVYHDLGRGKLANSPEIYERIASGILQGKRLPLITFKDYPTNIKVREKYSSTSMHFGNTTGLDGLKGQDLVIIGTYFQNEQFYKLIGCYLGADLEADRRPTRRECSYGGKSFQMITYKDPVLRRIQLYSIGSEMEQAVGRARLLWCDSTVYLFSAYPVEQAEYFVEDYLHDRTE